ncbi:MAG: hypothetical protein NTZ46_11665, partial [Verrucomicrobia bacterium]|nr:hypothetical protein [Verrucomicrobiota bacterium]
IPIPPRATPQSTKAANALFARFDFIIPPRLSERRSDVRWQPVERFAHPFRQESGKKSGRHKGKTGSKKNFW